MCAWISDDHSYINKWIINCNNNFNCQCMYVAIAMQRVYTMPIKLWGDNTILMQRRDLAIITQHLPQDLY